MKIEMYADVLCPWCYIGKRRLAAALASIADRDRVQVVWRSFELAPHEGKGPGPTAAEAMAGWWGDHAQARIARIRALGAAEGLELNLHIARPVNTFDAHRLCHLAADHGLADDMMERLLHAYHTEGLNVADPETLERLGTEAGLAAAGVRALLDGDAYAERVRADERRAAEQGVTGVPSLVVDDHLPVSAVQPPEVLHRLLSHRLASPAPPHHPQRRLRRRRGTGSPWRRRRRKGFGPQQPSPAPATHPDRKYTSASGGDLGRVWKVQSGCAGVRPTLAALAEP